MGDLQQHNYNQQIIRVFSPIASLHAMIMRCMCIFAVVTASSPLQAGEPTKVEGFNCGALKMVTLRSGAVKFSGKAGHTVSAAEIFIPSKRIQQKGILHSQMGGMDRTFTRRENDNFRSTDDTNMSNPVMMNIRAGGFFYSKKRAEITVVLLSEAYTCIPE